jgi:hypothetical protein
MQKTMGSTNLLKGAPETLSRAVRTALGIVQQRNAASSDAGNIIAVIYESGNRLGMATVGRDRVVRRTSHDFTEQMTASEESLSGCIVDVMLAGATG